MLSKRIFSSAVLIGIIIFALAADWRQIFSISISGAIVTVFIARALYEFFTMLEKKQISVYKYVGVGIGTLLALSVLLRFEPTKTWEFILIAGAIIFLILMQFRRRNSAGVTIGISTTVFGILYIAWFFSFLIKIIYLPGGVGLLASVLVITKLGDIGAFLVGVSVGRHPLIPRISPKKTVEGSIGGLAFSVFGAVACRPFIGFSYAHLVLLGVIFGVIGQLGDLSESLLKRDCQVKDSGNIIPGMGGLLDEIDSLLFAAPAFYFYMSVVLK